MSLTATNVTMSPTPFGQVQSVMSSSVTMTHAPLLASTMRTTVSEGMTSPVSWRIGLRPTGMSEPSASWMNSLRLTRVCSVPV